MTRKKFVPACGPLDWPVPCVILLAINTPV